MALMIRALYEALMLAGVPEDKAGRAAEAVAQYENRLAKIAADAGLLKWMVGFNLAVTIAVLFKMGLK
jgi:hypothetical protein